MPSSKKMHFVMVSFPAYGHLIPLLELAKKIAQRHHVTFAVTKSHVTGLEKREMLTGLLGNENISLVGFDDGIPEDRDKVDSTPGLQRVVVFNNMMAPHIHFTLENVFKESSSGGEHRPNHSTDLVVICDQFLTSKVVPFCHERKITCFVFNAASGMKLSNPDKPSALRPPSEGQGAKAKEPEDLLVAGTVPSSFPTSSDMEALREINKSFELANGLILNSFREADEEHYKSMLADPRHENMRVFCVGPLFPPVVTKSGPQTEACQTWLDNKTERSVLYISFGTVVSLSEEQITEFSKAIDYLSMPVIFSLPDKYHHSLSPETRENANLLLLKWAPQKLILGHRATALFLTHSGWNSIMESITCGVPMTAFPLFADQHGNAAWIESKGMGLVIPGTRMGPGGRVVPAHEIRTFVQQLCDSREKYEAQTSRMAKLVHSAVEPNGSSYRDLEALMHS